MYILEAVVYGDDVRLFEIDGQQYECIKDARNKVFLVCSEKWGNNQAKYYFELRNGVTFENLFREADASKPISVS